MDSSGFMSKYYDWASFETFVRDLYEGDGDVTVQRDVTETDRYGAKRQTDVKITRRSRFHRFTTLVECKRWKEPVGRDRIDVLASSIEALGANNGAIFTTTGFEEGAIAYAKGKGIELFVVRDLTPEEWGLPGRHISLHLHVNAAEFQNIQFAAQAVMLIDAPPGPMELGIELSADKALDPDFDLFSVKTGERGANLVGILGDAHRVILTALGNSMGVFDGGKQLTLEINARCELDFTRTEFHQLRLPKVAARIERIGFTVRAHISQSAINVDRGQQLDFAVMVESYVSDQRLIAHRRVGDPGIVFQTAELSDGKATAAEQPLQNGSLLRVSCSPWVGIGDKVADMTGVTGQLLRVVVETEGRKPQLSLVVQPLNVT
ncbi:Restriction endonuclease [Burkholderia pseudomallei]|uniref:restriction endonuclease n=2 Tax=Burkholderiaceae TaxID=119060 RepID=UPI000F0E9339|nr:restriction endonuclease [Burkholderia pseudomallei]CAJ5797710.1 Restriction endonuclease [Burkholderia pseudomallei]CAJ6209680.1 Restriction endonuclease [Burkholderia pseudomallei]CAJ6986456.1 Restriction endonuclease [Burkholderia pseudomallei]CAJ7116875.1 Restriction endonuclease [Burkholderia pseudomallei]VBH61277.1 Restriction endonuclease [Burkholderia pseudomallei]